MKTVESGGTTIWHHYLWLDLETTGLDPHGGDILEVAAILADDGPDGDMTPVRGRGLACAIKRESPLCYMTDYVRDMHESSGLLADVLASDTTLADAEAMILGMIGGHCVRGVRLAGNSVHFDLAWIRVHMPTLAASLHHRVLDVSTLLAAAETWGTPIPRAKPVHRAEADVLQSLDYARVFRAAAFGGVS